MKKMIGNATLEVILGDITLLEVDVIVNAANRFLAHGGGVAWAIVKHGGPVIQQESDAIIEKEGPLEVGEAVITSGGNLPAQFVIHAAGPIWSDKSSAEADRLLGVAVRNSLALADDKGLRSIALPAISTGIYHFPVDRAAKLILGEVKNYLEGATRLSRVVICLYDASALADFEAVFAAL